MSTKKQWFIPVSISALLALLLLGAVIITPVFAHGPDEANGQTPGQNYGYGMGRHNGYGMGNMYSNQMPGYGFGRGYQQMPAYGYGRGYQQMGEYGMGNSSNNWSMPGYGMNYNQMPYYNGMH